MILLTATTDLTCDHVRSLYQQKNTDGNSCCDGRVTFGSLTCEPPGSIDLVGTWYMEMAPMGPTPAIFASLTINPNNTLFTTLYLSPEARDARQNEISNYVLGTGGWVNPKMYQWSGGAKFNESLYVYSFPVNSFAVKAFTADIVVIDDHHFYQTAAYWGCDPAEIKSFHDAGSITKPFPDYRGIWIGPEEWTRATPLVGRRYQAMYNGAIFSFEEEDGSLYLVETLPSSGRLERWLVTREHRTTPQFENPAEKLMETTYIDLLTQGQAHAIANPAAYPERPEDYDEKIAVFVGAVTTAGTANFTKVGAWTIEPIELTEDTFTVRWPHLPTTNEDGTFRAFAYELTEVLQRIWPSATS